GALAGASRRTSTAGSCGRRSRAGQRSAPSSASRSSRRRRGSSRRPCSGGGSALAAMLESTKTMLKRRLDERGLVAAAYDARARAAYLTDRAARARNERFRRSRSYDGLPLPPPALVYSVAGHFDLEEYYESGRLHAELFRALLAR